MLEHIKPSRQDKVYRFVCLLILTILMILIIYPLIFVIFASFSEPVRIYEDPLLLWPKGLNVESYKLVFENQDIWLGYRNSLIYAVVGTFVNIIMTILGSYPLSKKDLKGKGIITVFFTITMFFNGGLIPTYLCIDKLGLLDNFWVMIIPGAVSVFNIIIMRTYFQTRIPSELEDAAMVDGCTNMKLLIKIVLPLSKPIIAVMVLFYGVGHWNAYFNAMIYLQNRNLYPLQLFLREILVQNQMSSMLQIVTDEMYAQRMMAKLGLKYAVIIVSTLPIFIIYPLLQKFFKEGILIGAIKG